MKIIIEGEVKEIAALLHGGAVERLNVEVNRPGNQFSGGVETYPCVIQVPAKDLIEIYATRAQRNESRGVSHRERMGAYSSSSLLFNPELVEDLANKLGKTLSSKIEQANIEARTASDKIN